MPQKIDFDVVVGHPSDTALVRESVSELVPLLASYAGCRLVVLCPDASTLEKELKSRVLPVQFVDASGNEFYRALFDHFRRGEAPQTLCFHPAVKLYSTQWKAIWEMRNRIDWVAGRRGERKMSLVYRSLRAVFRAWYRLSFKVSAADPGCPFFFLHRDSLRSCVDALTPNDSFWWEITAFATRKKWKLAEIPLTIREGGFSFPRGMNLALFGLRATLGMSRILKQRDWNRVTENSSSPPGDSKPNRSAS